MFFENSSSHFKMNKNQSCVQLLIHVSFNMWRVMKTVTSKNMSGSVYGEVDTLVFMILSFNCDYLNEIKYSLRLFAIIEFSI